MSKSGKVMKIVNKSLVISDRKIFCFEI